LSVTCGKLVVFFPDTPVSPNNESDRRDITEISLKVTVNTLSLTPKCRHHSYIRTFTFTSITISMRGRFGRDRMIVGFTTACAICAYHHYSCEFEPRSWRGVLDTTLCDKVRQLFATGRWFSPWTPISSANKTECHDITEILLKLAPNTINVQ
jgi:hypothetical protein